MKKFIIAEICVVLALVFGFWLGRFTSGDKSYENYYDNADKAWTAAQSIDNPPITLDEPDKNRLRKVRAAYREVFDQYPDSLWADDAIYQLASRIPRTDEEAFALFVDLSTIIQIASGQTIRCTPSLSLLIRSRSS